jgi:hypothetical protein
VAHSFWDAIVEAVFVSVPNSAKNDRFAPKTGKRAEVIAKAGKLIQPGSRNRWLVVFRSYELIFADGE